MSPGLPFADVALPVAVETAFTYLIPEDLRGRVGAGHRVPVPLGRRRTHGYVIRVHDGPAPDRLRPLGAPEPEEPLFAADLLALCRWVSEYYLAPLGEVLEAAAPPGPYGPRARRRSDLAASADTIEAAPDVEALPPWPALEREQQEAFDALKASLERRRFGVHLLQGVPGSGKTEIYLALAREVLRAGGSVLWLEPEIGLATHILERVERRFGSRVGLYHSMTGATERRATWERARSGALSIVVGARSAVFVPLKKLELVIIDEEQEPAYKQEDSPRYHGRDVAIVRARACQALVVLGSATPSLEAVWNARCGKFALHRLTRRHAERKQAAVRIVDLREDPGLRPGGGPVSLFSGLLAQKVRDRLATREQTILFLNRRGHSTLVQCPACGEIVRCSRCDVVLTYHRATADLRCHHCGLTRRKPERCPACGSERLFYGGAGTQKLEEAVAGLFPRARILRLDADTTRRKGSHAAHLHAVTQGDVDILVGTQMIAKGFDFPNVTLVGVLRADRELALPEFRSAERAFQILTQVAGRAGRGEIPGEVVLQTLQPAEVVIRSAAAGDFDAFADAELPYRRRLGYPPFGRMVHLLFDGANADAVRRRAEDAAADLAAPARREGVEILGPAPMFLTRLKGRTRWHVSLLGKSSEALHRLARRAQARRGPAGTRGVRLHVDVDPIRTL